MNHAQNAVQLVCAAFLGRANPNGSLATRGAAETRCEESRRWSDLHGDGLRHSLHRCHANTGRIALHQSDACRVGIAARAMSRSWAKCTLDRTHRRHVRRASGDLMSLRDLIPFERRAGQVSAGSNGPSSSGRVLTRSPLGSLLTNRHTSEGSPHPKLRG